MADTFPVSGNIDPTSFPHLLVDLHRHGATGSLKVNGPVFPKALYFRGGRVLFGSSNDPRDQLGAILIESGKITREQLDDVNAKVGPGNPLAKVLAESGFVNQRELGDAARVKVERILSDLLSWDSGSFEFEDGVLPKGAVDLKLSTERLLIAAVQKISERAFALRHLGGDLSVVLEPTPDGEPALSEVRAEVWPLLERLDGQRSLADAASLTRMDEFVAAKMACAMIFLGIIRRRQTDGSELDLAAEARDGFGDEDLAPAAAPPHSLAGDSGQDLERGDGEPVGVADEGNPFGNEPLGVADDSPGDEPLGIRDEPSAEPEAIGFATAEPEATGFAMAEPEPLGFETPEPEPTTFGAELGVVPGPKFPAPEDLPAFAPEPTPGPPSPTSGAFAFADEAREPETVAPENEATVQLPVESAEIGFASPPPRRPEIDTVPGDRPVYVPPAVPPPDIAPVAPPEPPTPIVHPPPPAATHRPTREDLAALDALLHPDASTRQQTTRGPAPPNRFEPKFRPPSASSARIPRTAMRPAPSRSSRTPLIAGGMGLVVAAVAVAYFVLGKPTPPPEANPLPTAAPVTVAPSLSAPVTVAAAPGPAVDATASPDQTTSLPSPSATAEPTPAATALAPTPVPPTPPAPTPAAVRPTPAPVSSQTPGTAAEALALLRQGRLADSARGFATSLSPGPADRYSIQALVACAPETVQKAVENVSGEDLFILPVELEGRPCYRVCWGVYGSRETAEAATSGLPTYFREGGARPRVTPLADLLR